MSFFHKKKCHKIYGPPLCHLGQWLIFYWPKKKFRASLWLFLISGTVTSSEHVSNGPWLLPFPITDQSIILQKGGGFRVFRNRNRNKFINQIRAPGGHIQITLWLIHNNNTNNNYDWYTTTIYQPKYSRWNINNCVYDFRFVVFG